MSLGVTTAGPYSISFVSRFRSERAGQYGGPIHKLYSYLHYNYMLEFCFYGDEVV